jgi:hypothetical protein
MVASREGTKGGVSQRREDAKVQRGKGAKGGVSQRREDAKEKEEKGGKDEGKRSLLGFLLRRSGFWF